MVAQYKSASEEVIDRCMEEFREDINILLRMPDILYCIIEYNPNKEKLITLTGRDEKEVDKYLTILKDKGWIKYDESNNIVPTTLGKTTMGGYTGLIKYVKRERLESGVYTQKEKELFNQILEKFDTIDYNFHEGFRKLTSDF